MIERKCLNCKRIFYSYPSRITGNGGHVAKFCSRKCYSSLRNEMLNKAGFRFRFQKGHLPSGNRKLPKGRDHHAWKGNKVGYRGLHYWLYRIKGVPKKCAICGMKRTTPKDLNWANIDHHYRRNPDDYVALCRSCHKIYDLFNNSEISDSG